MLRLLAAEGMVSLGLLSLDGTKLAGNAAQEADRTLPQIGKILAEAAAADAAGDAVEDGNPQPVTPRALARRAERREPLARAACESEWLLACTAHNLRKLHRHRVEG